MSDKDKKDITIILNGTPKIVPKDRYTYNELVDLAYPTPPTGENIEFTIMFSRGHHDQPSGTLQPDDPPLKLQDRMIIDVTPTDRS